MKIKILTDLIKKASKKENEDGVWEIWKLDYPEMQRQNKIIPFEKYLEKVNKKPKNKKTDVTKIDVNKLVENSKKVIQMDSMRKMK